MSNLDIMSMLGNAPLELTCPKCKSKVTFTLKDVGNSITCPDCNSVINIQKKDDFDSNIESANEALQDFKNALENFGG